MGNKTNVRKNVKSGQFINCDDIPVEYTKAAKLSKRTRDRIEEVLEQRLSERLLSRIDPIETITFVALTVGVKEGLIEPYGRRWNVGHRCDQAFVGRGMQLARTGQQVRVGRWGIIVTEADLRP